MHPRRSATIAFAVTCALAVVTGCSSTTDTATGPGSTTGTAPVTTAGTVPGTPPTTCVSVPASTGVGTKGGGELICSGPGGTESSPPNTDTTIPGATTTAPSPDATHGVAMITTGGSPCPPSATVCTAMYEMVPSQVQFERTDAPGSAKGTSAPSDGNLWVLLDPGQWHVTATPIKGDRVCSPVDITITAGQQTQASIDCALPG